MNKTYNYACQYRKNHQFEAFIFVHNAFKSYMKRTSMPELPMYGDTTSRICFEHYRYKAVNGQKAA